MIDAFDDLAIAKKPFKVVAVIPVKERLELLPLTISRLYRKNGVDRVICVGDGLKEKAICMEAGAIWVNHVNYPLGAKWNAGFKVARGLKPDAVLYVGSSDFVCDDWIEIMRPYTERHHFVGVAGNHYIDVQEQIRVVNWLGYNGERSNESIGIGRLISSSLLDKIGWQPFDDKKDNSMDRCMKEKCAKLGIHDFFVKDSRLLAASISVNPKHWVNKHNFEHHWQGIIPRSVKMFDSQEFINQHFPEANQLQKALCG
jgi:hypothetical protein